MLNTGIKKANINDLEQLQKIATKTFVDTFSSVNTEENMQEYLQRSFSAEKLTAELNDTNAAFYFAIYDGDAIGYLKLNFGSSQTEIPDANAVEIERIYVLKEFHGKQVGHLLYQQAMQVAKERKATYVWLGVWEENHRAIAFYKKSGFIEFDKHLFKLGNDVQTDIMMKVEL